MLAKEFIPVVGHVGLVPSRATWTGGFKAVGKTAAEALQLFEQIKSYEDAGAIAVELEVVPVEVATELSKRTSLLVWSMGAGAGCDAQYLFSNDILGYTEGHIPRHSKVYRDFRAEYDRLQLERISAFKEFVNDVDTGVFPETSHLVHMDDDELDRFFEGLDKV
jgi:3-methyl-2-oxobutanoate hydroxymethyltransferase